MVTFYMCQKLGCKGSNYYTKSIGSMGQLHKTLHQNIEGLKDWIGRTATEKKQLRQKHTDVKWENQK